MLGENVLKTIRSAIFRVSIKYTFEILKCSFVQLGEALKLSELSTKRFITVTLM